MTLTAQQKANRLQGVGCSEVLAALGKDPRCTPLELYGRKVGELPEADLGDNERVLFGNLIEPVLRPEFGRRKGVRVIQRHQTLHHPDPDVPLLGHIDGWIPQWKCGLEIKTADRFEAEDFGQEGTDQVPVRYFIQCAAYIAITDCDEWHLAVLIGGNQFKTYRIARDPDIEAMIVSGVCNFWQHVQRLIPPDPITPEDVRLRWPRDFGTSVQATLPIESTVARLREMRKDLDQLQAQCDAEAVAIQTFMAENSELIGLNGDLLATWRTARASRRLDVKALESDYPQLTDTYRREVPGSRRFLLK